MNYYNIDSDLNGDLLEDFINKINEFKPEPITIYICSEGGEVGVAETIIDIINHWPFDVFIVARTFLMSAAVDLFLFSNSIKILTADTVAMIHLGDILMSARDEKSRVSNISEVRHKTLDLINQKFIDKLISIGIPEDLLNDIKAYKDVYITSDDFEKIAINAEKHFFIPKPKAPKGVD